MQTVVDRVPSYLSECLRNDESIAEIVHMLGNVTSTVRPAKMERGTNVVFMRDDDTTLAVPYMHHVLFGGEDGNPVVLVVNQEDFRRKYTVAGSKVVHHYPDARELSAVDAKFPKEVVTQQPLGVMDYNAPYRVVVEFESFAVDRDSAREGVQYYLDTLKLNGVKIKEVVETGNFAGKR